MKYSKNDFIKDLIHGFVCGVIIVAVGLALLYWFRNGLGEWLGFGGVL